MRSAITILLSACLLLALTACAAPAPTGSLLLSEHDLNRYEIRGMQGEIVGDVRSLVVDLKTGVIRYVVVEPPARPFSYNDDVAPPLIPVPWSAMEVDGPHRTLVIPADRATLEAAPRLDTTDLGWQFRVSRYWEEALLEIQGASPAVQSRSSAPD